MPHFSWSDELYTGNAMIDGDHRELIARIDALIDAMESAAGTGLSAAMQHLVAYTKEHFAREEAEMRRIRYVAALAHGSEHAKLLQQIGGLEDIIEAGGRIHVAAVSDFLRQWLRDHILATDMRLAAALKEAPESAAHKH